MAKTAAELIQDLTAAIARTDAQIQILLARFALLEKELERSRGRDENFVAKHAATEERVSHLRAEVDVYREELRKVLDRLTVCETRNAALEERAKNQEKTADRGWQLWLAALGFGFGLISLLVTAALQLKK